MAIGHIAIRTHERGKGHSAAAGLAYRLGLDLDDNRTGERHCYAKRGEKGHIAASGMTATGDSFIDPAEFAQRMADHIEATEKHKRARLFRDFQLALPFELDDAQIKTLTERFTGKIAQRYECTCVYAIHRPSAEGDARNHHAHVVVPTRDRHGKKLRQLDEIGRSRHEVKAIRHLWQQLANEALQNAQLSARVDCGRRRDRNPAPTLGAARTAIERKHRRGGRRGRKGVPDLKPQAVAAMVADGQSVTGTGRRLQRHTQAQAHAKAKARARAPGRVPALRFTPSRSGGTERTPLLDAEQKAKAEAERAVRELLGGTKAPAQAPVQAPPPRLTPKARLFIPGRTAARRPEPVHAPASAAQTPRAADARPERHARPAEGPRNPQEAAQRPPGAPSPTAAPTGPSPTETPAQRAPAPERRRRRNAGRRAAIDAARARKAADAPEAPDAPARPERDALPAGGPRKPQEAAQRPPGAPSPFAAPTGPTPGKTPAQAGPDRTGGDNMAKARPPDIAEARDRRRDTPPRARVQAWADLDGQAPTEEEQRTALARIRRRRGEWGITADAETLDKADASALSGEIRALRADRAEAAAREARAAKRRSSMRTVPKPGKDR